MHTAHTVAEAIAADVQDEIGCVLPLSPRTLATAYGRTWSRSDMAAHVIIARDADPLSEARIMSRALAGYLVERAGYVATCELIDALASRLCGAVLDGDGGGTSYAAPLVTLAATLGLTA